MLGHSFGGCSITQNITPNGGGFFMFRVSCERKKWNKKQEDLPKEQPSPHGPMLQKRKGAQIIEDKSKETGDDKTAEEGPSLGKTDPRKDTKGKASPGLWTQS